MGIDGNSLHALSRLIITMIFTGQILLLFSKFTDRKVKVHVGKTTCPKLELNPNRHYSSGPLVLNLMGKNAVRKRTKNEIVRQKHGESIDSTGD